MNVTRFCYFRTSYSRGCDDEDQRIFFLSQLPGFDTMQHKLYDIRRSFIPAAPSTQDEFNVTSDWFQIDKESMVIADISHNDGLRVLIFSTSENLSILSRSDIIFGDGTFRICTTLRYDDIIYWLIVKSRRIFKYNIIYNLY